MGGPFDPSILPRRAPFATRSALCHGRELEKKKKQLEKLEKVEN